MAQRKRKVRGVDYNTEIPFQKTAPAGFYDIVGEDEQAEASIRQDDGAFKSILKSKLEAPRKDLMEAKVPPKPGRTPTCNPMCPACNPKCPKPATPCAQPAPRAPQARKADAEKQKRRKQEDLPAAVAAMWKPAVQRLRPIRPSARPASASSSSGRPPTSASVGQLAGTF